MPPLLRWRISGGQFDPSLLHWLALNGFTDRMTVAEITPDRPLGVLRYLGPAITVFGQDFPYRAVGMPVEKQPSREYAEWVGKSYQRVAESGEPHHEHIDALISEPEGKTRRSRYERMVLPFRDPQGRKLIIALSVMKADIAIPLYR
jgi:hypothetical protein